MYWLILRLSENYLSVFNISLPDKDDVTGEKHVSYLLINLLFLWNPCIPPWPPPYPRCWVRSKCEKAFRPRYPQPPARARPAKRVSLEHRQVCCPRPFPSEPHSERVSRSSAGIHTQSEYVPHSFARSEWRDVFHWEAQKTTRWRLFDAHNPPRHESNSTPAPGLKTYINTKKRRQRERDRKTWLR